MLSFDSPVHNTTTAPSRPPTLNFHDNNNSNQNNIGRSSAIYDSSIKTFHNSTLNTNMRNSKSDYDAFRTCAMESGKNAISSASIDFASRFSTSHTMDNIHRASFNESNSLFDSSDVFNSENAKTMSYSSLYPHVEIVNNNQMYYKSPPSSPLQEPLPSLQSFAPYKPLTPLSPVTHITTIMPLTSHDANNMNNNFNNNNYYYNDNINHNNNTNNNNNNSSNVMSPSVGNRTTTKSFGPNYSHDLSSSLASTPGVTIMPLNSQTNTASNLFNYGFFDTNNDFNNTQCKFEVSTVDSFVVI